MTISINRRLKNLVLVLIMSTDAKEFRDYCDSHGIRKGTVRRITHPLGMMSVYNTTLTVLNSVRFSDEWGKHDPLSLRRLTIEQARRQNIEVKE